MRQLESEFQQNYYDSEFPFASIYFRTNDRRLDGQDVQVINQVANLVKRQMAQGRQPELTLIGRSDHRGSARKNLELSHQRLKAVADLLGKLLASQPGFKYVWAASVGEMLDVGSKNGRLVKNKSTKDKGWLAFQRSVAVHSEKDVLTDWRKNFPELFSDLPRIKKYELGHGFVKETPPANVRQELLPGGFSW